MLYYVSVIALSYRIFNSTKHKCTLTEAYMHGTKFQKQNPTIIYYITKDLVRTLLQSIQYHFKLKSFSTEAFHLVIFVQLFNNYVVKVNVMDYTAQAYTSLVGFYNALQS